MNVYYMKTWPQVLYLCKWKDGSTIYKMELEYVCGRSENAVLGESVREFNVQAVGNKKKWFEILFCFFFFVDYEKTTKWSCSWIKEGKYGLLLVFWEVVLITYIENIISFAKYTVCCITNLYLLNIVKFFSVSCAQHFFFFPQTNFLAKPRELLKSGQVVPCPLSVNEYEQVYLFNF